MMRYLMSLLFAASLPLCAAEIPEQLQPTTERFNSTPVDFSKVPTASYSQAMVQSYSSTAWFQSIDLTLRHDDDGDGYYSQIRVRFDADSSYSRHPVYAVYSLINNGYERTIHTSSIFELNGGSRTDWFEITADLKDLSRTMYWMRIQLRDAQSGQLLAEISGNDTAVLDRMPLEDQWSDNRGDVVIVEESAGSAGFSTLLLVGLAYLRRARRKGS